MGENRDRSFARLRSVTSSMVVHPSAALQRPVDDLDRPAARRFRKLPRRLAERNGLDDRIAELVDVAIESSGFLPVGDQPLHGAAGLGHVRRQSEHVEIGLVANDDPRGCIIKNKTLRNVVHGNPELAPLGSPAAGRSTGRAATAVRRPRQGQRRAPAAAVGEGPIPEVAMSADHRRREQDPSTPQAV